MTIIGTNTPLPIIRFVRIGSAQQIMSNNAITYNVYGDPRGTQRLWPLDTVPLIIDDAEWAGG